MNRLPVLPKIAWTLFIIVWTPVYWLYYGPRNFLWLCDLANFLICFALWVESPLIMSSQAVSLLLIQSLWFIDVLVRAVFGVHLTGGTEYMFNPDIPAMVRLFSFFHIITPALSLWAVWRLGYDRRGWLVQTGLAWVILPVSLFFTEPGRDINWVWGLFGRPQKLISPYQFLILLMIGYPLVIYLPTHLLLKRLFIKKTGH